MKGVITMGNLLPPAGGVPRWVKASLSYANGNCVEVAELPGGDIGVRDSKSPAAAPLRFTPAEWAVFIASAKAGDFD
jgi:Domain of unknown function (DUF397)